MYKIVILKSAEKTLRSSPVEVRNKFDLWRRVAQLSGVSGLVQMNGFRDHSLKGEWQGARSSSLNYQWRVIYRVDSNVFFISVLAVTPHDYRRKL